MPECRDGEDEQGWPPCPGDQFFCEDPGRSCVDKDVTCDGIDDCPNGWDETNQLCGKKSTTCILIQNPKINHFLCPVTRGIIYFLQVSVPIAVGTADVWIRSPVFVMDLGIARMEKTKGIVPVSL